MLAGFELPLREPVALGQRRDFVGADPLHEAIEMLPDARLGAPTEGRLEEDFQCPIELGLGGIEVTLLQFPLASLEVPVG